MLRLENVNKFFNKGKKNENHVINNVNLEFDSTGLVALLGASGSGKTTILNTIGGLDNIKSGNIYIESERITSTANHNIDRIRNLNIGYIFQDYKLIDDDTVYDNIALSLKLIGIKDKEEIKKRVYYVLEKVGIYRYRNRLASSLSGGERQRVGIARALVKNPKILLCDEPTGNLDSKNSLEIMNIIKTISKKKLVILVTHERNLAEFFASRIIEIQDGKVIKDYLNEHANELDYQIDNRIYLKDFKKHDIFNKENTNIEIFSDNQEKIHLKIVIKGNNIYLDSNNIKTEIINESSGIELVNEHYKPMDKDKIDNYDYNLDGIFNENIKTKYSSIFNLFSLITSGFKRLFKFSKLKKVLLAGFFLSGIFTMYAVSSICATKDIRNEDFVSINRDYLVAKINNISIDNYLNYEKNVNYMLPTDSTIYLNLKMDDFYQLSYSNMSLNGSLTDKTLINNNDILLGNYPNNVSDIVIDEMVANRFVNNENAVMVGIKDKSDLLNKKVTIPNMGEFIITGIISNDSPSIYMDKSLFINILANSKTENEMKDNSLKLYDYKLFEDNISIKEGKLPKNDYEIILNITHKYEYELNKEIDIRVNNKKLKVVGYYDAIDNSDYYLVNNNTIKYTLIEKSKTLIVYASNKEQTIDYFNKDKIDMKDSYQDSRNTYLRDQKENMKNSLTSAGIVLIISLIEIFLMIRSSFLSRIKEVGIYRAIGLKKLDIYKMFAGEIIAITTLTNVPAIIITSYVLNSLSNVSALSRLFLINAPIILFTILIVYVFNLVVGLLPVFTTIIKTPASILARYDLD